MEQDEGKDATKSNWNVYYLYYKSLSLTHTLEALTSHAKLEQQEYLKRKSFL